MVEVIEILGDGRAFGDVSAVLELEHRDRSRGVPCQEFRAPVLASRHINGDEFDVVDQALFGKRYANSGGVGKALVVVDLQHDGAPSVRARSGPGRSARRGKASRATIAESDRNMANLL